MKLLKIFIFIFTFAVIISTPIILYTLLNKTKYKCVNNDCIQDNSGSFKSLNECEISCSNPKPSPKPYKCVNNDCIQDDSGSFKSLDDCKSKCKFYLTINNYKLDGTEYKTFTGDNAFQDAKDFCSNDINCQGINGFPNSASVVKEATQIEVVLTPPGVYTSISPTSKGKYVSSPSRGGTILVGTEYKQTTQFESNDINGITKYCRDDKDAEGYNSKFVDGKRIIILVKNVTGTENLPGSNWYGVKYGDH